MNKTFLIAFVALAICSLTSCENTINTEEAGIGYLSINLGQDNSIVATKTDDNKHDVTTTDEIAEYYVQIDNNTEQSFNEVYGVSVPLTTGSHIINAYNKSATTDNIFAWDAPLYSGSSTVSISQNSYSTCNITCTLANARLIYTLDGGIADVLSNLKLVLKDEESHEQQLYPKPDGVETCYIKAGIKATLVLTAAKDGKDLSIITPVKNSYSETILAKTQYKVNYALATSGNIAIAVDENVNEVDLGTIEINLNGTTQDSSDSSADQSSEE